MPFPELLVVVTFPAPLGRRNGFWLVPLELAEGESMLMSSMLMPEEDPRGSPRYGGGGGGVVRGTLLFVLLVMLLSEKVSQNIFPLEFLITCCLKVAFGAPAVKPRPLVRVAVESTIIVSSLTSSKLSWVARLGLESVAVVVGG